MREPKETTKHPKCCFVAFFFAEKVFFEALNQLNQLLRSIRFVVVEGDVGSVRNAGYIQKAASKVPQDLNNLKL